MDSIYVNGFWDTPVLSHLLKKIATIERLSINTFVFKKDRFLQLVAACKTSSTLCAATFERITVFDTKSEDILEILQEDIVISCANTKIGTLVSFKIENR